MPCISRPAVLYLRPAPALAYCCLFLINRHADAWLCVFTVVCLRCLHTVTVPCLTPTGRPACTLAVNLTSVSHSCKCCNFSCHFLSHIMTLSHCFTWCSSYPLYARRHSSFKGGPCSSYAVYFAKVSWCIVDSDKMELLDSSCTRLTPTLAEKRVCTEPTAISSRTLFTSGKFRLFWHRASAPLEFSVLAVEFSIYQLRVIYSAAVFAVWLWLVCPSEHECWLWFDLWKNLDCERCNVKKRWIRPMCGWFPQCNNRRCYTGNCLLTPIFGEFWGHIFPKYGHPSF